jgi:hypothetical protein
MPQPLTAQQQCHDKGEREQPGDEEVEWETELLLVAERSVHWRRVSKAGKGASACWKSAGGRACGMLGRGRVGCK